LPLEVSYTAEANDDEAIPALAQPTIKDALVKHWKVTGEFTIAVAQMMPAEATPSARFPRN
jgi:hypothetical protein